MGAFRVEVDFIISLARVKVLAACWTKSGIGVFDMNS